MMANILLTFTPASETGIADALLEGELILPNAACLQAELLRILPLFDHLHLRLENVTALDLACAQVLVAFRKSIELAGQQLSAELQLDQETRALLSRAGLLERIS